MTKTTVSAPRAAFAVLAVGLAVGTVVVRRLLRRSADLASDNWESSYVPEQ